MSRLRDDLLDDGSLLPVEQLEGDIARLTAGLQTIAKADPKLWAGEIPIAVQRFAQNVLDRRWGK